MTFRSVNLNPPRGPRGGGGGGRGGGNYRGGGGAGSAGNAGYQAGPSLGLRIDASGRVDQGFGPVGGTAAGADPDIDIFGLDDPSTFQTQQQTPSQRILYVPRLCVSLLLGLSFVYKDQWNTMPLPQ